MRITSILFVAIAAALIGCGGSSGLLGPGGSPSSRTKEAVKAGYSRALIGAGAMGVGPSVGGAGTTGTGGSGGTSGSTGGMSGGIPGFGFLAHDYGNPNSPSGGRRLHMAAEVSTSGSTTGTDGGTPGPSFYFDDYLGLWLDSSWTDTSATVLLYEDELKTKPAGSFVTTFPSGWGSYPYSYNSTFEIIAGPYAGAHGGYESVAESDESGHMTYTSTWPGYGSDSGDSSWGPEGGTWRYESHLQDGTWFKDNGFYGNNGTSTFTSEDSYGYRRTYTYRANGSGHGRIEGPDAGLPATIVWDQYGHTIVTYADGTVDEWDAWEVGGTTGVGTTTTGESGGVDSASTTGDPGETGGPETTSGSSGGSSTTTTGG